MLDIKSKDDVSYGSSDKQDWYKDHVLTDEQVRQIIQNKYDRAIKDQEALIYVRSVIHRV